MQYLPKCAFNANNKLKIMSRDLHIWMLGYVSTINNSISYERHTEKLYSRKMYTF